MLGNKHKIKEQFHKKLLHCLNNQMKIPVGWAWSFWTKMNTENNIGRTSSITQTKFNITPFPMADWGKSRYRNPDIEIIVFLNYQKI